MAGPAWFTVIPRPEVGFTDQLMQLSLFGRLGHALGLSFIYTPVANERTHESVWQHFGIDHAFAETTVVTPKKTADFPISDKYIQRKKVKDADGLLGALRADMTDLPADAVVSFRLDGARRRISQLVTGDPDRFPWPEADTIRQTILTAVPDSPFPPAAAPRILVHIRRGDVAVFNTQWGRAYKTRPGNLFLANDSPLPNYDLRDFFSVTRRIQAHARPQAATAVFSDGCERSKTMLNAKTDTELGVDANRRRTLMDYCDFEDLALNVFAQLPQTRVAVGENLDGFKQLVRGLLEADIVVYSNAQRLAPKLVGAIGETGRPKLLAELAHENKFDPLGVREVGITEAKAQVAAIHPEHFDLDAVIAFTESFDGSSG